MTENLDALMAADAPDNSELLAVIRLMIAKRRDLDLEVKDAEENLEYLKKYRRNLELEILPTKFAEAGIDSLGIPAEGNHPAVEARLGPYCHASIPASWPAPKKQEAFETLDRLGVGGLVRRVVTVELPPGDHRWEVLKRAAEELGLVVEVAMTVPWSTLTAAVRDLMTQPESRRPQASDLDAIGAHVGKIVKLKEPRG